jgi:hypothetical protein
MITTIREFLLRLRPSGNQLLYAKKPNTKESVAKNFHMPKEAQLAETWVARHNDKGFNTYFALNPVEAACATTPTKAQIEGVEYLILDLDAKDFGTYKEGRTELLTTILTALKKEASLVLDTGNGLHAIYQLDAPLSVEEGEAQGRLLKDAFPTSDNVQNANRLSRLPFTTNYAPKRKIDDLGYPEQSQSTVLFSSSQTTKAVRQPQLSVVGGNTAAAYSPEEDFSLILANPAETWAYLNKIDPDIEYADWIKVGMAIRNTHGAEGLPIFDQWSRQGSKYDAREVKAKWKSFQNSVMPAKAVSIGSLKYLAENKTPPKKINSELSSFADLKVEDCPMARLEKFGNQKYLIPGMIVQGGWTNIYAKPNSGKTLLTLWLLLEEAKKGRFEGLEVFHCNFDDDGFNAAVKEVILDPHGIQTLNIGNSSLKSGKHLVEIIDEMVESRSEVIAKTVLVVDTLKKLASVMSKDSMAELGMSLRAFTSYGGTVIILSHTNKNNSEAGRVVFAGVQDIQDDPDAAFALESSKMSDGRTTLAKFTADKQRGRAGSEFYFGFKQLGIESLTDEELLERPWQAVVEDYRELLDSVNKITADEYEQAMHACEITLAMNDSNMAVKTIRDLLELHGPLSSSELIEKALATGSASSSTIKRAMTKFKGEVWETKREGKAVLYELMPEFVPLSDDDLGL